MSDYVKVLAVIRSCKTPAQNAIAKKVVENYAAKSCREFMKSSVFSSFSDAYRSVAMSQELLEENERMLVAITSPAD